MSDEDWESYTPDEVRVSDDLKSVLKKQVEDLIEARAAAEEAEAVHKAAQQRLRNIEEHQIPKTFEDMGLDDDTVLSVAGLKISIKQSVHASPSAANREAVYDWLEEHGHGGIIKRKGLFDVGLGQEREAKRWIKSIKKFPGEFQRRVESATLRAFVNAQIAEGNEIPMELFGAYTRRVAQVK